MTLLLFHQLEKILDDKIRRKSIGREGCVFLIGRAILIDGLVIFFVEHHNNVDVLD